MTDPKRQGHGRDLSRLAEKLDDALTDLAVLRENLSAAASADAPPDTFYDVMQRVDQTFVDLIVHGHIEELEINLARTQGDSQIFGERDPRQMTTRANHVPAEAVAFGDSLASIHLRGAVCAHFLDVA